VILLPTLLALGAAANFGVMVHLQKRGLMRQDPLIGAFILVASMAASLWLISPWFIEWHWFTTRSALIFCLAGFFMPAAAQLCQILAVSKVGPALSSAIGAFVPFFAVIPAVTFLGEPFGFQLMAGMTIMTVGLVLAAFKGKGIVRSWPIWALLVPLFASLMRGTGMPIVKVGMNDLPSPLFATLVMATTSTVVLALVITLMGRPKELVFIKKGAGWFAAGGAINAFATVLLNTAMKLGGVSLAAPLAATAPLWALMFGYFIFKNETLTRRHLLVALMVVLGSVLIVTR